MHTFINSGIEEQFDAVFFNKIMGTIGIRLRKGRRFIFLRSQPKVNPKPHL